MKYFELKSAFVFLNGILISVLLLGGCSQQKPSSALNPLAKHGSVLGGQQPVAGATVQLYSVGTAGDGSAATPLLAPPVTTDTNGGFSLPNSSSYCPSPSTLVYIVATGGNPGLPAGINNAALSLMTALGPCGNLTSATFININELTTVAAVWALAPYMSSYSAVGSSTADATGLANAFTLASEFVNTTTGTAPGLNVPAGMTVPVDQLDTIADILTACVNSAGGVAGDGSVCGMLMSAATPVGGTVPTNVIAAAVNVANDPTLNTATLYSLISSIAPFQPSQSSQPPDLAVRLNYPSGITLSPGSLTFAAQAVGSASVAQSVLLSNTGNTVVNLSGISLAGEDAGDFELTDGCGTTIAAGANCSLNISFAPTATGTRTANVQITSDAATSPSVIELTGSASASAAQAVLSTYVLEFEVSGATRDITLSNTGGAALTISSITTGTQYFVATNNCGASLSPGASCVISVVDRGPAENPLDPSNALGANQGKIVDQLTVTSNDPSLTQSVALINENLYSEAVSLSNVAFSATPVGSPVTTTLSLNLGSEVSTLCNVSIAGDFTVSTPVMTTNGNGGSSCLYTVTFTPMALGTRTGTLSFGTDGSYIPLTGVGVAAVSSTVTLSPATTTLQDFSGSQPITLSNYLSVPLNIQSVAVSAGFSQTNNCGSALAVQSICTITVSSTQPAIPQGIQGLVTVTDDAGTQSAQLVGIIDPLLQFGTWAIGAASPTELLTSNGSALASGADPGDFPVALVKIAEGIVGAQISFNPTVAGQRSAIIQLSSNSSTSVTNYLALGTGVPSAGNGPLLTFGPLQPVSSPVGRTTNFVVPVNNSGTTTVQSSVSFTGANASDFGPSTVGTYVSCASVAAGAQCSVPVEFTPSGTGTRTANLVVTDGTSGQSFTVALTGTGLPAAPSTSTLTLPTTSIGATSSPASFTVTSPANHPVVAYIDPVTSPSPTAFTLTKSTCAQGEVPCLITATYTPYTVTNSYDLYQQFAYVIFIDTVTGSYSEYEAIGNIQPPPTIITFSPPSLAFAARAVNTTSISQTVTMSNMGTTIFYMTPPALGGADASEFLLTTNCGSTLAVSASCTINVSFAPATSGSKSASIVTYYGNAQTLTVPITGTAQ